MPLTAIALNCTLKRTTGEKSSTDRMIELISGELKLRGVDLVETIRLADQDIFPGVTSNEGPGDAWPDIRRRILETDVLILGTPVWMGQMSSVAKRVLERMDAFLSETDAQGRTPAFGKVAVCAVVGNEDGAHHIAATVFQALNDVGWTIPSAGSCYWVGEAMSDVNFIDLDKVPDVIRETAAMLAGNTAHLAGLLKHAAYPGVRKT